MTNTIAVLKDEDNQQSVPSAWRDTLIAIVEAFKDGDYELQRGLIRVRPITPKDAARIAQNITSYPATLVSLPEASWKTSVCQWMRSYWTVLVDLYTIEDGESDLVLFVRVYEDGVDFFFDVQSVHVP